MKIPKVVALGEVLWDLLPTGRMLGGAPANFAFHAHAIGAASALISRLGNDPLGEEIRQRFSAAGLPDEGLQVDADAPTGTVSVELSTDGQPRYLIHEDVAWDALAVTPVALAMMAEADAICFGTLAQRSAVSRASIRTLVAATPPTALRIFDVNLRQNYYTRETMEVSLDLANVLKLNESEWPVMAAMFDLVGELPTQLTALAARFDLRAVALTLGAQGSLLVVDGIANIQPGRAVAVSDTVGAGDAFTAVLGLGLLAGWPTEVINVRANAVAAYVCSQSGATPDLPAALRATLAGIVQKTP